MAKPVAIPIAPLGSSTREGISELEALVRLAALFDERRDGPTTGYEFAALALDALHWPRLDGTIPTDAEVA